MGIRSFVRRSRPLRNNKKLLLDELLVQFKLDLKKLPLLLEPYSIVNLEIGFGKGDFLVALSLAETQSLNIGCDPYIEGVANLLQKIKLYNIENIRIWPDDALLLLTNLQNHSVDNIYILFPDPWPKRKQQKRRLINNQLVKLLTNKLKSCGTTFIATDHHDYAKSIFEHFNHTNNFICKDISTTTAEFFKNSSTQYYKKNIEGKEIKLFKFQKM